MEIDNGKCLIEIEISRVEEETISKFINGLINY